MYAQRSCDRELCPDFGGDKDGKSVFPEKRQVGNDAGAQADIFEAADFDNGKAAGYDAFAFGCPAMGAEELEDSEFEPMFADVEGSLAGKKVALFGSYGWGDGQWMRDWEDRCKSAGISLAAESVLANETPGDAEIANCKALGAALA